jgi:hypothetical protein
MHDSGPKYGKKFEMKYEKKWIKAWTNVCNNFFKLMQQHKGLLPLNGHHLPNLNNPTTTIVLVVHEVTLTVLKDINRI